jgi:hypothetical protein
VRAEQGELSLDRGAYEAIDLLHEALVAIEVDKFVSLIVIGQGESYSIVLIVALQYFMFVGRDFRVAFGDNGHCIGDPTRPTIPAHTDRNSACDTRPLVQSLARSVDDGMELLRKIGLLCNLPS